MSASPAHSFDVVVIGAGSVGIAVAYYLAVEHGVKRIALVDPLDPMSLTSAQSGENYRNWWPHPVMTAFTDHSIDLMEALDRASGGRLGMTRGGYALATRAERPRDLIDALYYGYGAAPEKIRIHETSTSTYQPPASTSWAEAPDGVDVLLDRGLIRRTFPSYAADIAAVLHIRRAGSISTQQLGQFMLERTRSAGLQIIKGRIGEIAGPSPFTLSLDSADGMRRIRADRVVNAAGPFAGEVAAMLGDDIPVRCVFQQKIAFPDREGAIPRDLPFSIDLDRQVLAWNEEDRELLQSDPDTRHLAEPMVGGIHCRPDGGINGTWIKLGWAYNKQTSDPRGLPPIDPQFPDTVIRGASRLNPKLGAYIGRLPRSTHHYGGYYTMTAENWPLIGRMEPAGAFMAAALSGFGSMAASAAGAICASWVAGKPVPIYAHALSRERHKDQALMAELERLSTGIL